MPDIGFINFPGLQLLKWYLIYINRYFTVLLFQPVDNFGGGNKPAFPCKCAF